MLSKKILLLTVSWLSVKEKRIKSRNGKARQSKSFFFCNKMLKNIFVVSTFQVSRPPPKNKEVNKKLVMKEKENLFMFIWKAREMSQVVYLKKLLLLCCFRFSGVVFPPFEISPRKNILFYNFSSFSLRRKKCLKSLLWIQLF